MISPFFTLSLAAHIIGDFYLQNDSMAQKKKRHFSWLLAHSGIYTLVAVAAVIPVFSLPVVLYAVAMGLCHFLVDLIKMGVCRRWDKRNGSADRFIFAIDQLLHIAILFTLSTVYISMNGDPLTPLSREIIVLGISGTTLVKGAALALLAGKPVNVAFIRMFSHFKPVGQQEQTCKKAGATIGFLERLTILVLFGAGQFAASGLILTAKSIVRYSKISEDKAFGEYYLLGTLFSVLSALIMFLLIW